VAADDVAGLVELSLREQVDLVVVGPEAPLVAGLADELAAADIPCFGPSAAGAQLEGSKAFCKEVMQAAGVPTAAYRVVTGVDDGMAAIREIQGDRYPAVIKADGLAAGKGVFVCRTPEELDRAVAGAAALGGPLVIEELLEGPEVSLFALCDGRRAVPLGAAQDFKRAFDGDAGPNTGGMGAFSPVPWVDDVPALVEQIHQPVVDELARRGSPFVGCLFAGLMLTQDGPRVLEFNARFGDPETQVLVPRLRGDLLAALAAAAGGDVDGAAVEAGPDAAVTVVLTGPDYPDRSDYAGARIAGIDGALASGALVFHGGTAERDGALVTNGGRILSVTALAPTIEEARGRAYEAVDEVRFEGMRFRRDIAAVADG